MLRPTPLQARCTAGENALRWTLAVAVLRLPPPLLAEWRLRDGDYRLKDRLGDANSRLQVANMMGFISLELAPLQSVILELQN